MLKAVSIFLFKLIKHYNTLLGAMVLSLIGKTAIAERAYKQRTHLIEKRSKAIRRYSYFGRNIGIYKNGIALKT